MDKRKKIVLIIIGTVLAVTLIGIIVSSSSEDTFFSDLVNETLDLYPYTFGLGHADDGSYMTFRINPHWPYYDNFGEVAWESAFSSLKHINQKLGFSPALYEKMTNTTEAMGVQTDSNENFKVTWSYSTEESSESGLYIIYERN